MLQNSLNANSRKKQKPGSNDFCSHIGRRKQYIFGGLFLPGKIQAAH
jgi:hypothetical protein